MLNGEEKVLSVSLNKDAVDPEDVETLEEMIVLAMNQALSDIERNQSGNGQAYRRNGLRILMEYFFQGYGPSGAGAFIRHRSKSAHKD